MKVTKPATLGTLEFDAIIERSETLESEVPQYATESGYSISDNICLKAVTLDVVKRTRGFFCPCGDDVRRASKALEGTCHHDIHCR